MNSILLLLIFALFTQTRLINTQDAGQKDGQQNNVQQNNAHQNDVKQNDLQQKDEKQNNVQNDVQQYNVQQKREVPKKVKGKHITVHLVRKDWAPTFTKYDMKGKDGKMLKNYPGTIEEAFTSFINSEKYMYTKHEKPLSNAMELLSEEYGYDKNLESIFVPTYVIEIFEGIFLQNILLALAMKDVLKDYNVFSIDFRNYDSTIRNMVIFHTFGLRITYKSLGRKVGDFLDSAIRGGLLEPKQIHLIGFCWAGQIAAYIARDVKRRNNNQKVKSLLGLDPSSLGLSNLWITRIVADDAEAVQVLHTNSIFFGTFSRKAVNIVFNNGSFQPGCPIYDMYCHHNKILTMLWYMILYPDKFKARKCRNWLAFKFCRCNEEATITINYPPEKAEVGTYYIRTLPWRPYGIGEEGSKCIVKKSKEPKKAKQGNKASPTANTAGK